MGRLDQDTTGLLLLTDDGQFIHRMTSPKKGVAKIYRATCADPVSEAMLEALRVGVQLNDEPAPIAALACEAIDNHNLRLILAGTLAGADPTRGWAIIGESAQAARGARRHVRPGIGKGCDASAC